MYNFYIAVFLVGVLYTLVSVVISGISGAFHGGGDLGSGVDGHLGHNHGSVEVGHSSVDMGHAQGIEQSLGHIADAGQMSHSDLGHNGAHMNGDNAGSGEVHSSVSSGLLSLVSVLINPMVAVSFLTVFGGFGILGVKVLSWGAVMVFVFSFVSAVSTSAFLYNFIVKPIYKSENTSNVSREKLIGLPAEVTSDILEMGYGTIHYTVNSLKYTGPAKHLEGKAVKQGEKVFICKIENNTFYVSELPVV